jgi:hypothetical protein
LAYQFSLSTHDLDCPSGVTESLAESAALSKVISVSNSRECLGQEISRILSTVDSAYQECLVFAQLTFDCLKPRHCRDFVSYGRIGECLIKVAQHARLPSLVSHPPRQANQRQDGVGVSAGFRRGLGCLLQ